MSKDFYSSELSGERKEALAACKQISADLELYKQNKHKDARKNAQIFCSNVMIVIARLSRNPKAHHDIYVNIFTRIFVPNLDSTVSPPHWKKLLQPVGYFCMSLIANNLYDEATEIYDFIGKHQLSWSSDEDFKYLLSIHSYQLKTMLIYLQDKRESKDKIERLITNVLKNIKTMILSKAKSNEEQTNLYELVKDTTLCIIKQCTKANRKDSGTVLHSTQIINLFDAYNELLYCKLLQTTTQSSTEVLYQLQLSALKILIQMDMESNFLQRLSVQHLRVCQSVAFLRENLNIANCNALLYNFFKLLCAQRRSGNFSEIFTEIFNKFIQLLKTAEESLLREVWFQDFLLLFIILLTQIEPITTTTTTTTSNNAVNTFWQQMNGTLYGMHFKLLASIFRLTTGLTQTKLIIKNCCDGAMIWRHYQLLLANVAIETYSFMLKSNEAKTEEIENINRLMTNILKHAIESLLVLENNCTKANIEMQKLCIYFSNFMQRAQEPSQALFVIKLAEQFIRLKGRVSTESWTKIMHRICLAGAKTENAQLGAELRCCYIVDMLENCNDKPEAIYTDLKNQIYFYYQSLTPELKQQGFCLLEMYTQSRSPFKSLFQKPGKRFLHWNDTQYAQKYFDTSEYAKLYTTLAQRCQTKYDFVHAVHAGKLIKESDFHNKIQNIYELLLKDKSQQTRLQQLTLAHAAILLLFERLEKQKLKVQSNDFKEDNLYQLLRAETLKTLTATNEMENIELAFEALDAFQTFFERADVESLPPHEGGFLQWTRILEDLVTLSVYFQATGYTKKAMESWLLHYRIANMIDDGQNCIRSATFFCEHIELLEKNDTHLDIDAEILATTTIALNNLKDLPNLLRRQQHFTLIFLCQLGYYYATKKDLETAQNMLKYVYHCHREQLKRESSYDIVLLTADIVQFRILWKHCDQDSVAALQCGKISLLHEIDVILERIVAFVQISSIDYTLYNLILLSGMGDIFEYATNRLCDNFANGYFGYMLKIGVEMGAAIRTAQILGKWALINLQMEYLHKAEVKFLLIESLLGLYSSTEMSNIAKKVISVFEAKSTSKENYSANLECGEVRKVVMPTTPIFQNGKNCISSMSFEFELSTYLDVQNRAQQRSNEILQWTRFTLGCLRARFNFLAKHYQDLEDFYERCRRWLKKRQDTFHYNLFQAQIFTIIRDNANFLRAVKKFEKANELCETSIIILKKLDMKVDPVYHLNFVQQLEDIKLEISEQKYRKLPQKQLTYPTLTTLAETLSTPLSVPSKSKVYAQIPMTTTKTQTHSSKMYKKQSFQIYSDRKPSYKSDHSIDLLKAMSTKKDLKFDQIECATTTTAGTSHNEAELIEDRVIEIETEMEMETVNEKKTETKAKPKMDSKLKSKSKFKFLESIEIESLENPTKEYESDSSSLKSVEEITAATQKLKIAAKAEAAATENGIVVISPRSSPTTQKIFIDLSAETTTPPPPSTRPAKTPAATTKTTKAKRSKDVVTTATKTKTTLAIETKISDDVAETTTAMRRLRLRSTKAKSATLAATSTTTSSSSVRRRPRT